MTWNFDEIKETARQEIAQALNDQGLEAFRVKYLGRKGLLAQMYSNLSTLSKEEKPTAGKNINQLRNYITHLVDEKQKECKAKKQTALSSSLDVTIPGVGQVMGHKHLLTQTIDEICDLFEKLGFAVMDTPEIETEFNNFTALNIPADHPSRDGFDTFYVNQKDPTDKDAYLLLRSQTSPGQIRIMQENEPPLAVIIPGKVYRPDAVDASHSFMFHQIEGLLVDKDIKFPHLKGLLTTFCKKLFGKDIKMRFRPHYFPFTEPSAEVDIFWKGGKKQWLEIMGCGIVHPKVFEAAGYKKGKYSGLAFGLGVERIAMLKHGIPDIRLFYENDQRFLEQF